MKINGRLLLLAVVTGLFMRIWSGSERGPNAAQARRRPAPVVVALLDRTDISQPVLPPAIDEEFVPAPYAPPEVNPDDIPLEELSDELALATVGNLAPVLDESWTEKSAPIPLPAGLSAGAWRVVDDSGRVARLVVAPRDLTDRGATADCGDEVEFHVAQIDGGRWYFIRLQSAVEPTGVGSVCVDDAGLEIASASSVLTELARLAERPAAVIAGDPELDVPQCQVRNRKFDFIGYEVEPDRPAAVDMPEEATVTP